MSKKKSYGGGKAANRPQPARRAPYRAVTRPSSPARSK